LGTSAAERLDVVQRQLLQGGIDTLIEPVRVEKIAIRSGRDGEPAGHVDALRGELADHLAERGVLPADPLEVVSADGFEGEDVVAQGRFPCSRCTKVEE
jgi:hypothetical protein